MSVPVEHPTEDERPEAKQPDARQRATQRIKSLLRGVVYFNNHRSSYDCLVRDISATGARLSFSDPVVLPDVIDLHIPNKDQNYRVRVMWRHSREAGVVFDVPNQSQNDPVPQPQDLASRVSQLEKEVSALKLLLKALKAEPDSGAI